MACNEEGEKSRLEERGLLEHGNSRQNVVITGALALIICTAACRLLGLFSVHAGVDDIFGGAGRPSRNGRGDKHSQSK